MATRGSNGPVYTVKSEASLHVTEVKGTQPGCCIQGGK